MANKQVLVALVALVAGPRLGQADAEEDLPAMLERTVGQAAPSGTAPSRKQRQAIEREIAARRAQLAKAPEAAPGAEQLPLAEERCALGVLHAHAGELALAQLQLAACEQPGVGEALRQRGGEAQSAVARALRKSSLSPIDISTTPAGWFGSLEAQPDGLFLTPITLWLPAGKHAVTLAPSLAGLRQPEAVHRELKVEPQRRGSLFYEAPPPTSKAPGTGVVKFEEEAALEPPQTTRPPPEKHRPLIPERYRRGLGVTAEEPRQSEHRGLLAIQLGAGRMAPHDSGTTATATRLAVHGRAAFAERFFLEVGLDWAHHFEPGSANVAMDELGQSGDAFGALLGARVMIWRPGGVSFLAGLRGRLEREADARGGAELQLEGKPLPRWPLAIGASAEIENGLSFVSAYAAWEVWKP